MERLPYSRQALDEDDIAAVTAVLRGDYVTQGPAIPAFEAALAKATGACEAVACSSGTAALHLAYASLGLQPGEATLLPAVTFAATASAALYCGAESVFADVDPLTGLSTVEHFEEARRRAEAAGLRVRLAAPVSLAGRVPDLPALARWACAHDVLLVEDAAHSLGAQGVSADGTAFASAACEHTVAAVLSFHPVKHICTGEGGAVLLREPKIAETARLLRSHGVRRATEGEGQPAWFQEQVRLGFPYRLTDIQAALGQSQLRKLPAFLERRRALAARYRERLAREPLKDFLCLPPEDPGHGYHLFVVHFADASTRDRAHAFLAEGGIGTQVHYHPLHRHAFHASRTGTLSLPGAEHYASTCLSLPLYPHLSYEDQDRVVERLAAFARSS